MYDDLILRLRGYALTSPLTLAFTLTPCWHL